MQDLMIKCYLAAHHLYKSGITLKGDQYIMFNSWGNYHLGGGMTWSKPDLGLPVLDFILKICCL